MKQSAKKKQKPIMKTKKVAVCRYDAVLRKFKKIFVKKVLRNKNVYIRDPRIGYEDMTVTAANSLPGSKDCNCVDGFSGDGIHCVATDSCDVNPCKHGNCTVTSPESYSCTCLEGWAGSLCDQSVAPGGGCMNEAPVGTRPNVDLEEGTCKDFAKTTLWPSILQEMQDLKVPLKYFDPSKYSEDDITGNFLAYIFDGKELIPDDFIGLQEAYNVSFVSRRLEEGSMATIDRPRSLASDDCKDIVLKLALDVLVIALSIVGLPAAYASKVVRGVAYGSKAFRFGVAFETAFVRSGGRMNWEFLVNAIIIFFTNLSWLEIKTSMLEAATELTTAQKWTIALTLLAEVLLIYSSGGYALALKIAYMLPSAITLYDDSKLALDECYGDAQSVDCQNFAKSGGWGVTTSVINMNRSFGNFSLSYNMNWAPDDLRVFYEGKSIYWTGGFVSGVHTEKLRIDGKSQLITVVVTGRDEGTVWDFTVSCPTGP